MEAVLESTNLGTPNGSAFMMLVPMVVLLAPPKERMPSTLSAAYSSLIFSTAPLIMIGVTSPVAFEARISLMSPPPALATSAAVMSGVIAGSPPMPASTRIVVCPLFSINSLRKLVSAPFVSRVETMTMLATGFLLQ